MHEFNEVIARVPQNLQVLVGDDALENEVSILDVLLLLLIGDHHELKLSRIKIAEHADVKTQRNTEFSFSSARPQRSPRFVLLQRQIS
jgi:hypothetical protein